MMGLHLLREVWTTFTTTEELIQTTPQRDGAHHQQKRNHYVKDTSINEKLFHL